MLTLSKIQMFALRPLRSLYKSLLKASIIFWEITLGLQIHYVIKPRFVTLNQDRRLRWQAFQPFDQFFRSHVSSPVLSKVENDRWVGGRISCGAGAGID